MHFPSTPPQSRHKLQGCFHASWFMSDKRLNTLAFLQILIESCQYLYKLKNLHAKNIIQSVFKKMVPLTKIFREKSVSFVKS